MTIEEQAERIWPILILCARHQQILSYSTLERLTGVHRHLQANALGKIYAFCKKHHYPPLTAIVVNEGEGIPGHLYTPEIGHFEDQCRAFVFDWFKLDRPAASNFGH